MAQQDEDYSTMILVMSQCLSLLALLLFLTQLLSQIQERPSELVVVWRVLMDGFNPDYPLAGAIHLTLGHIVAAWQRIAALGAFGPWLV